MNFCQYKFISVNILSRKMQKKDCCARKLFPKTKISGIEGFPMIKFFPKKGNHKFNLEVIQINGTSEKEKRN